ncbi:OV-16 antigen [Aphelenchoides bicaudatus]|nr:OV-16 antigen [Aphelenchoides bicaudatus]
MRSLLVLSVLAISIFAHPADIPKSELFDDDAQRVLKAFQSNGIIPDVLSVAAKSPSGFLKVKYAGKIVNLGTILYPDDTNNQPTISWDADPNSLYTVVKVDPDAPSRADPVMREWRHWILVNVKGSDLSTGTAITEYNSSTPPPGTGYHRYVLLVYKQSGTLTLDPLDDNNRDGFHIEQFAQTNNLGRAVAGNFFLCQHD